MRLAMKVPEYMSEFLIKEYCVWSLQKETFPKVIYEIRCAMTPRERSEAEKQLKCLRARKMARKAAGK